MTPVDDPGEGGRPDTGETSSAAVEAHRDFARHIGTLLASWGLPQATGRVFGYLLIRSDPVDLDEIAEALGMSKSAVSVATRQLDVWCLARRIPQRGSRRVSYLAVVSPEVLLSVRQAQTRAFREALAGGLVIAEGPARERLAELAEFFESYLQQVAWIMEQWQGRSGPSGDR